MNIDDEGHKFTGNSIEYRRAINRIDTILGVYLPIWLDMGYQIMALLITEWMILVIMEGPCQNTVKFPSLFFLMD